MENLEENNGLFCTQDRYWLCLNTGKPDWDALNCFKL